MEFFLCNKLWLMMLISTACVVTSAEPKPTQHKSRVVDRQMSGEKHFEGREHNPEYDHDAFIGKDEAKAYDELSPEESQERLALLIPKIDKDGDNKVSPVEMQAWIRHVQQLSMEKETNKQWRLIKPKDPTLLTWDEYLKHTYGDNAGGKDGQYNEEDKTEINQDERRWKLADLNHDGVMSKEEFTSYLHPEEMLHMQDAMVQDTLDEVDKDGDGMISMQEYLNDLATPDDDDEDDADVISSEPGWSSEDEQEFRTEMDKDGDGKLSREEIYKWIVPEDYDHVAEESNHLFDEADEDKDGFLSGQEIVDKYDLFVGSQATDFGNVLQHEEL